MNSMPLSVPLNVFMRLAPGAGLGMGVGIGLDVGPDIYVDSVNGSDSNDGLTAATALQSLTAAETAALAIGNGVKIGLAAGSSWRDEISLPTLDDVQVFCYGDVVGSGIPIIDCADVVTGWTLVGGTTNVYQKTITMDIRTSQRAGCYAMAFENGRMLTSKNEGDLDANPGSWWAQRPSVVGSNTVVVKIHPFGSTTPGSDGKTYEVATREAAITAQHGCTVRGVHARKNAIVSGAIVLQRDALIDRCVMEWGNKHNGYIASGEFRDCVFVNIANGGVGEQGAGGTLGVAYQTSAAGLTAKLTRCGFVQESGTIIANSGVYADADAWYMHDSNNANLHASFEAEQCWLTNLRNGMAGGARLHTHRGHFFDNTYNAIDHFGHTTQTVDGALMEFNTLASVSGITCKTSTTNVISDCAFRGDTAGGFIRALSGAIPTAVDISCCVAEATAGASNEELLFRTYNGVGTLNIDHCIAKMNLIPLRIDVAPTTFTASSNVYHNTTLTDPRFTLAGTTYTGIAAWRTATGQDMDSVKTVPGFSGTTANGDFRLTAGGAADLLSAGPSRHWNWNARGWASGPPSRWPVVPETVADSRTYVANPTAWNFYP